MLIGDMLFNREREREGGPYLAHISDRVSFTVGSSTEEKPQTSGDLVPSRGSRTGSVARKVLFGLRQGGRLLNEPSMQRSGAPTAVPCCLPQRAGPGPGNPETQCSVMFYLMARISCWPVLFEPVPEKGIPVESG